MICVTPNDLNRIIPYNNNRIYVKSNGLLCNDVDIQLTVETNTCLDAIEAVRYSSTSPLPFRMMSINLIPTGKD